MNLHNTIKARLAAAKSFTKDFQEEVKQAVKDYKADDLKSSTELATLQLSELVEYRYKFTIPLIFTNHEAMIASLFDRVPDIIISQGGKNDSLKKQKVEAAYKYLTDKLQIQWFMQDAAWWFILVGFAAAHGRYKKESESVPVIDEATGEIQLDEMNGMQPMMREVYTYDDPILDLGDPLKEYWSPESEFSVTGDKVPFYFREKKMRVEDVKEIYGKKVEPDCRLEVAGAEEKKDDELDKEFDRVKVYFYYGDVPKDNRGEVKDWSRDATYYIVQTEKEILYKEKLDDKYCKLIKWYGPPNEFFGFGIGKIGRNFQREKTLRRSQQMRYADVASHPKLLLPAGTTVDEKAINDPREVPTVLYSGEQKPEYMSPPDMSKTLVMADQKADEDAQKAFGLLDLGAGGQQSMTDKATGQAIFAEASERRMRQAKRRFVEFYEQVIIMILKLAQKNWETDKWVKITDDEGNQTEVQVSSEDLSEIDFDTDVHIDGETLTYNKDVLRQQAIEFYNATKDDPNANHKNILTDTARDAFGKNNPERYVNEPAVAPGTPLFDEAGNQYMVDESGSLVSAPMQQDLSQPTDMGGSTTPGGLQGQVNSL